MKLRTVIAGLLVLVLFTPFLSLPSASTQSTSTTTTMTISQPPSQGQCTMLTLAFSARAGEIITGSYGSDVSINFYILAPSDLNAFQNCRLNPSARPIFIEEYLSGYDNPYRSLKFPTNGTYYFVFVYVRGPTELTKGYATVKLSFPSSIVITGKTGSVSATLTAISTTSSATSFSTSISTTAALPQTTTTPTSSAAASTSTPSALASTTSSATESVLSLQTPVTNLLLVFGGFAVAIGGVVGATFLRNRKRRTLSSFLTRIDSTYNEFAVDREECRTRLERLKHDAIEMLNEGKINEGHFLMLDEKISEYQRKLMQAKPKLKRTSGADTDRSPARDTGGIAETAAQIKYCGNCGARLSSEEKVCRRCGAVQ